MSKISIIIPIYNGEKFISKCLDSIFKSNYNLNLFDVIIINDGTPDNTLKVVEKYLSSFNNISVYSQENKGLGEARNFGLKKAKGQYIWFVDQDDWISNGAIDRISNIISVKNPDILFFDYTYPNGKKSSIEDYGISSGEYSGIKFLNKKNVESPVWQYVININHIRKYNFNFYPEYHEDSLFTPIVLFLASSVIYDNNVNYIYNLRHDSTTTSSNPLKHCNDLLTVTKKLTKFQDEYSKNYLEKKIISKYISIPFFSIYYYFSKLDRKDQSIISKSISISLFFQLIRYNFKLNYIIKFFLIKIKWFKLI